MKTKITINYTKTVDLPCNYGRLHIGCANDNQVNVVLTVSHRLSLRIKDMFGISPHMFVTHYEDNKNYPAYTSWIKAGEVDKIIKSLSLLVYDIEPNVKPDIYTIN